MHINWASCIFDTHECSFPSGILQFLGVVLEVMQPNRIFSDLVTLPCVFWGPVALISSHCIVLGNWVFGGPP